MATGMWGGSSEFLFAWDLLFVVGTIIEVIIMLNLLIAIVSNAYQKVADAEILYTFNERVGMVQEW